MKLKLFRSTNKSPNNDQAKGAPPLNKGKGIFRKADKANVTAVISAAPVQNPAPSAGLLSLPRDIHSPLGKKLSPADWASMAATCKQLNAFYKPKIAAYKQELSKQVFDTHLIPTTLFSDPFFEKTPTQFSSS